MIKFPLALEQSANAVDIGYADIEELTCW